MKEHIMTNMINMGFNSFIPAKLLVQAQQVIQSMTGNASFPEPWPAPVPTLVQITTDLNALQTVLTATVAGDRTRIAERDSAAAILAKDLLRLARHVELQGDDDPAKLASSGFESRSVSGRRIVVDELPAPANLRVMHGALSGQFIVRASRLSGAGSYEMQQCTADPTVEANWIDAGVYKNCTRIQLNGLTPGKMYSVRLRAIGSVGPGSWTAAVSLIAM
jgi:hypothetical protein